MKQVVIATLFLFFTTHIPAAMDPLEQFSGHTKETNCHLPQKNWTFIIYMSADNDLRGFAARNIKQMAAIGSNEFVHIAVHLDIKISGNRKITRRYYIDKNTILHVNANDIATQKMDSGDPQTLISCCSWAINHYPAKQYALVLWNHGTGCLNPTHGKIISPTELFAFNPSSNKLELDRTMGFFDIIDAASHYDRGICWDDSTGNYLNNQKLEYALSHICTENLGGKSSLLLASMPV